MSPNVLLKPREINRNGVTTATVDVFRGPDRVFTDRVNADSAQSRRRFATEAAKAILGTRAKAKALNRLRDELADQVGQLVDVPLPNESSDPAPPVPPPDEPNKAKTKLVPLGGRDPKSDRVVLSASKTLPTARAYVLAFHDHPGGRTIHSYGGVIVVWEGNRYVEVEDEAVRHRLQRWLHGALRYVFNKKANALELVDFESNPGTIRNALESIRAFVHLPASVQPAAWLDDGSDGGDRPDPKDLLPCKTMTLHVPSGRVLDPTPALFNVNALDFDY
jgi:hypothetical protein